MSSQNPTDCTGHCGVEREAGIGQTVNPSEQGLFVSECKTMHLMPQGSDPNLGFNVLELKRSFYSV